MKRTTPWASAILLIAGLLATSCASSGFKLPPLPPITIALPDTPAVPALPPPAAPAIERGTLAVQVLDANDAPVPNVLVTLHTEQEATTNADGYAAIHNLEKGPRHVVIHHGLAGYQPYEFDADIAKTTWPVRLVRIPARPPEPPPVVVVPPVSPEAPEAPLPPKPEPVACVGFACVQLAAQRYPELLITNTFESCVEFTQRVLELLGPEYGHVGKVQGESQSVPHGFAAVVVKGTDGHDYRITGVSHDAIKHRTTGQVIDLLGNATANEPCDPNKLAPGESCWLPGPANIQWADVPRQFWRASNPFIPAVPVR